MPFCRRAIVSNGDCVFRGNYHGLMTMGATWTEFYKGRLLDQGYRDYAFNRYMPFIDTIVSHIKEGDRVIEIGCGLATITSLISKMPERPWAGFRCFDVCPEMVSLARINLESTYPVDIGDARLPTNRYPDVVHSHGMLEHFNDDDIRAVISANKADGARAAIHYVPGWKYEKPSFGDERLMTGQRWKKICSPTRITEFNSGYDFILEWDF
jgi:SAM-dependent methyltransferase